MTELFEFKTLGFIGLGAMGKPMLVHLANKLPPATQISVFDVVEQVVDEVCEQFPNRVFKGHGAGDVAKQVVSVIILG
jgi:3-hydroxyisobutyrate dehydrogenase-like beta-hydroxyacid dehydrogenase